MRGEAQGEHFCLNNVALKINITICLSNFFNDYLFTNKYTYGTNRCLILGSCRAGIHQN